MSENLRTYSKSWEDYELLDAGGGKKLERKKEIGELKITKVEDENFSICSVSSGGIEINSKFEVKAKLLVITKD